MAKRTNNNMAAPSVDPKKSDIEYISFDINCSAAIIGVKGEDSHDNTVVSNNLLRRLIHQGTKDDTYLIARELFDSFNRKISMGEYLDALQAEIDFYKPVCELLGHLVEMEEHEANQSL